MRVRNWQSISLLSALACGAHASAEEAGKQDGFRIGGLIVARLSLLDTTRQNNLDMTSQVLRLNGKYTHDKFMGIFELGINGNDRAPSDLAQSVNTTSETVAVGGTPNQVGIRKAEVQYALFMDKTDAGMHSLSLGMGRFRPGGADTYGGDTVTGAFSYTTSGYSSEDGIRLLYNNSALAFGSLNAAVAYSTAMPISLFWGKASGDDAKIEMFSPVGGNAPSISGKGQVFQTSNATGISDSRAIVVNLGGTFHAGPGDVEVKAYYGTQANAIVGYTAAAADRSTPAVYAARDIAYYELSGGYNLQNNLKAGFWYTSGEFSKVKIQDPTTAATAGRKLSYNPGSGPSDNYVQAGLGVNGNSKFWGMGHLATENDMLTFGAAYQLYMHRQSGDGARAAGDSAKNDVKLINLAAGYAMDKFRTELNFNFFTASNKVFPKGSGGTSTSMNNIYLMATLDL